MEYSKELLPITEICLNVTEACNFACKYCFTEHHPNFMTFDVAKDSLHWLVNNCKIKEEIVGKKIIPKIGFFGGEPTLMWDEIIVPLVNYAKENNIECNWSMTSNCSLLDKEKVDFLKENNIGLLLSMDGNKLSQNINRPCKNKTIDSFDVVEKNLPYIVENFPNTTFRGTITADTSSYLFDNIMYAASKGFNNCFFIINEFENWDKQSRENVQNEMIKYCLYMISAFINDEPFITLRPLEQAINKIVAINSAVATAPTDYEFEIIGDPEHQKCGLGSGYGSINYKGDIFSCQEVASREGEKNIFHIGNIYTGGIDEEKLLTLRNNYFNRKIKKYNYENPKLCETCPHKLVCIANACQVNNYILYKDFSATPDCWCWWSNLMLQCAQFIMLVLGKNHNVAFKNYLEVELTNEGGPLNNGY